MPSPADDLGLPSLAMPYGKRMLRTLGWVAQGSAMRLRQAGERCGQRLLHGEHYREAALAHQGERLLHYCGLASRQDLQRIEQRLALIQQRLAIHRIRRDQDA